ncbi:nitrogen fixation protein NifQ [Candidatus Magnetaquicoccus inordinatus]|uniref:nitrogen fixation protein NifQ n=1 Tax=Candidatus Magnetaquicoccus inordinatus TaxID=2496818 RepID=UPI00102C0749|nr:nitrogen fixation protein NifQ [Candidatus Magnetaquicoccus inordinatus]
MAMQMSAACIGCYACVDLCPVTAIVQQGGQLRIDAELCCLCTGYHERQQCAEICPSEGALRTTEGEVLHPPGFLTGIPLLGALDPRRQQEWEEIYRLLMAHSSKGESESSWLAQLLAHSCLGNNHLWQDMGLGSRQQLSELLYGYFRPLAIKNDRDMKWKKFFYKQLCEQEELRICQAPSCTECSDYEPCFGPEH